MSAESKKGDGVLFPMLGACVVGVIGGIFLHSWWVEEGQPAYDKATLFGLSGKPINRVTGDIYESKDNPFVNKKPEDIKGSERFDLTCKVSGRYLIQNPEGDTNYLIFPAEQTCTVDVR